MMGDTNSIVEIFKNIAPYAVIIGGLVWIIKFLVQKGWKVYQDGKNKENVQNNTDRIIAIEHDKKMAEERLKIAEEHFSKSMGEYKEMYETIMEYGKDVVTAIANNTIILDKMQTVIGANTKSNDKLADSIDIIMSNLVNITKQPQ